MLSIGMIIEGGRTIEIGRTFFPPAGRTPAKSALVQAGIYIKILAPPSQRVMHRETRYKVYQSQRHPMIVGDV